MTNRYPLILDTQDGTKIKEIPQGDSLYLSGNTIEGVGNINSVGVINATDFRINNQTISSTEFTQLTDTPASYTGQNNKIVKVKSDGSGLEFASAQDLGVLSGTDLTLSGDIYPETDNSGEIGTTSKKWNFVRSTNVQGNLLNDSGNVVFDSATGKITGTAISGNNISIFTNDANYITFADLSGTNTIDIKGDVIANDDSILVNSTTKVHAGNFKGNVVASDDTVIIDNTTKTITGNINGTITGDAILTTLIIQDNMYNDDSTLIYDSSTNTFNGNFSGTFSGVADDVLITDIRLVNSVLTDDSSVLIDVFNKKFIGDVTYTPGTPAHWSDPKPTTVAEALDKIAEILNSL